jgi:hypothetical protein
VLRAGVYRTSGSFDEDVQGVQEETIPLLANF